MNWFHQMGGMGMGMGGGTFNATLKAHSAALYPFSDSAKNDEVDKGGKILLPTSALDQLIRLNIQYPMLFKITNNRNGCSTHCGVLEFSSQEGHAYLPHWMMAQLGLDESQMLQIQSATLPKATFAKLKPQTTDFLQISNPRAVLEVELRKFASLTVNDRIAVKYNDQFIEFLVLELKPGNAVCIIECDVNLEFDAPEGYVDPADEKRSMKTEKPPAPPIEFDDAPAPTAGFAAFQGSGARLDGKRKGGRVESTSSLGGLATSSVTDQLPTVLPAVKCIDDYVPGKITFPRYDYKCRVVVQKELNEKAAAAKAGGSTTVFDGDGKSLRNRK